ncbi:ATPase [Sphingobium sp. DEHP117]|uniref:F0F1 ATP synthase subunit B family protein n=1 Tax=Sphingobium sp. DEHP117 TaxID=2993436 RepID=UPI0027D532AB|nr:ATPase [Sphingobium sp. DEHP117]MDQ4420882.1 ATPase [Sphingobium sp. DEHP117]
MPQIAQLAATYSSQIFWLLLTFGFVFFVIGLGMVPKVQSTVDARDAKIAEDLATAKASFARADELEEQNRARDAEARASAQAIVAAAKAKAAKDAEKKVAAEDKKIAAKLAEAEAAIAAASAKALAEIEAVSAEAAQDMVARISGVSITPDAAKTAVKAALNG